MRIIEGNILYQNYGLICHQVNCKGVMGAGLALALKHKYPKVFSDYRKAYIEDRLWLGNVIYTQINDKLWVANICGQEDYGRQPNNIYTDYSAVRSALLNIAANWSDSVVSIPYKMGCGLAGGNWNTILKIIEEILPNCTIFELKGW